MPAGDSFQSARNDSQEFASQSVIAPGDIPGPRFELNRRVDANGNLWLFGGHGVAATGTEGSPNDLWT
jgi:hypothetical protein